MSFPILSPKLWLLPLAILQQVIAAPAKSERGLFDPTVTISFPKATIVGKPAPLFGFQTEDFLGIPFAHPPVGNRRLRPPQPLTEPMGQVVAQQDGNICPQLIFTTDPLAPLPIAALAKVAETPELHAITTQSEDCLVLSVRGRTSCAASPHSTTFRSLT
jgi:triacylglycerol lipase